MAARSGHSPAAARDHIPAPTRCGKSKLYNVLLAAREDNDPKVAPMVPGTTLASPLLVNDLRRQGVPLMVGLESNNSRCNRTAVLDTEITRQPATLEVDGEPTADVWEEKWTIKHCSETIDITFCLAPDGQGGTNWSTHACRPA